MGSATTIVRFQITLSDVDRGVYEDLDLRVAQHPSETDDYLLTRVLAYALEASEGLAFSRGLCMPDEPALWAHDATGVVTRWIEVGNPKAERLHRASKACPSVAIYTHKDPAVLRSQLAGKKVHRADEITVVAFPAPLLGALAETLERTNEWAVLCSDGELEVTVGDVSARCTVAPTPLRSG